MVGSAVSCGICIFFILALEVAALIINIIAIIKASQLPVNDQNRNSIFILEIVTLVLSFCIGLLAWIAAAILLAMINKALRHPQEISSLQPNNSSQII